MFFFFVGDQHTERQALEGLGDINYNQGHKEMAFKYFLSALTNTKHHSKERIKLKMLAAYSEFKGIRHQTYSYVC